MGVLFPGTAGVSPAFVVTGYGETQQARRLRSQGRACSQSESSNWFTAGVRNTVARGILALDQKTELHQVFYLARREDKLTIFRDLDPLRSHLIKPNIMRVVMKLSAYIFEFAQTVVKDLPSAASE